MLYGNGTRGGVVNIITKKTNLSNFFEATLGSGYNGLDGKYSFSPYFDFQSGYRLSDSAFISLSGDYHYDQGYREGEFNKGYSVAMGLIDAINSNHTLSVDVNFYQDVMRIAEGLTLQELNTDRRQGKFSESQNHIKKTNAIVSINHNYTSDSKEIIVDTTAFYTYDNNDLIGSEGYFLDNKFGLNFKTKWNYGSGDLIAGYEFLYAEGSRRTYQNPMPILVVDVINNPSKISNSIFVLNRHNWTERFSTSIGLRYENAVYMLHRSSKAGPSARPTISEQKQTTTSNNFAIEILPNFNYSDTGNVYVKYERGFVSPSASELTNKTDTTSIYYNSGIKPETYDTAEIGWKDEFFGQFFSLAAFYTHTYDEIMYQQLGASFMTGGWRYYNLDSTQRAGVEFVGEQTFWDIFHMNQSLSYIYSNILKGENRGNVVPLVPIYKIALGFSIDLIKGFDNNLNIFLNTIFYGRKKDSNYNAMGAYNLTDIGLSWRHNVLGINFGIRNVFGTKYNLLTYQSGAETLYLPAPGRTFYLEARIKI